VKTVCAPSDLWHSRKALRPGGRVVGYGLITSIRGEGLTSSCSTFVVPRGAEHCPVAEEEAHILLIEATGTPNTGDAATAAPRRVI